jgi:hypothetical protein
MPHDDFKKQIREISIFNFQRTSFFADTSTLSSPSAAGGYGIAICTGY